MSEALPRSPKSARPLHLVEASRFNLEGREEVEAGKLRLLLREFGRNAASRDARGNGGKREDKAETAEFLFDGHVLFSEEDSTRESREEGPLLPPSYGGPVARKTRVTATFAMPEAVTNPIVA